MGLDDAVKYEREESPMTVLQNLKKTAISKSLEIKSMPFTCLFHAIGVRVMVPLECGVLLLHRSQNLKF